MFLDPDEPRGGTGGDRNSGNCLGLGLGVQEVVRVTLVHGNPSK